MVYELPQIGSRKRPPFDAVIDVRSPAEFAEDHIPGAISLPALDNEQRAQIGTIYTQQSRFQARLRGAAMVARNMAHHLETALADKPGSWRPLVYCWRGGQRSGSVATIMRQIGWNVDTLKGGYRSYRRAVKSYLYDKALPHRIILLDGLTGTGKTEILHRLEAMGHQMLDLEALARHRGSIFGSVSAGQPSQKTFESHLAATLASLNPSRPVLIEAESSKIGERIVPPSLWSAMRAAPRLTIAAPLEARARYTLRAYNDIVEERDRIETALRALTPMHGRKKIEAWLAMLDNADLLALIRSLIEDHYDPRYHRAKTHIDGKNAADLGTVHLRSLDTTALKHGAEKIAAQLVQPVPEREGG
jgi:tRNA 2-selenouridine synthase